MIISNQIFKLKSFSQNDEVQNELVTESVGFYEKWYKISLQRN